MKTFIKEITKSMRGSFLPIEVSEEQIVKEVNDSLKDLNYYGPACDKKNIKNDISSLNRDFSQALKEAKTKFEPAL